MIYLSALILCIILSLSFLNYNLLNLNKSNNLNKINKFLVLLLFVAFVLFTIQTINIEFYNGSYFETDLSCYIPDGQSTTQPQDPVRWWPSGVPQSMTVLGSMLGTFAALGKVAGVSPRLRVLASLGAGGASSAQNFYNSAIENPIGFNRLMYSINLYKNTGHWPSVEEMANSADKVQPFVDKAVSQADSNLVNTTVAEVQSVISSNSNNSGNTCNFVSNDDNDIFFKLFDNLMQNVGSLFKPAPVSGYLDDLIGQQIAIEFILLFATISLIFLIIAYIVNNLFLFNKDFIINRFGKNNKIIQFYLKYQVISIKFSLFILPLFMFIALFTLVHGLHFLITHQIPYDALGIDLHTLIKPK